MFDVDTSLQGSVHQVPTVVGSLTDPQQIIHNGELLLRAWKHACGKGLVLASLAGVKDCFFTSGRKFAGFITCGRPVPEECSTAFSVCRCDSCPKH